MGQRNALECVGKYFCPYLSENFPTLFSKDVENLDISPKNQGRTGSSLLETHCVVALFSESLNVSEPVAANCFDTSPPRSLTIAVALVRLHYIRAGQ